MKNSFVEICLYEVKPNKTEEFEALIKKVIKHHKIFPGVVDIRYMKRTHRQKDFKSVQNGEPSVKLTRTPNSVTYVLYWELKDKLVHAKATKSGLEKFYREFSRYLVTMPKIILGERIE